MLIHHGSVTLVGALGDLLRPGSARIVARFVVCVVDSRLGAQLWCRVLWWTLLAGSRRLVEPACSETQEEQLLGVLCGNVSDLEIRWNVLTGRVATIVC